MKLSRKQLENLIQNTTLDHKGKNLYGTCPYCGENEFGISLEDNHVWNCFRKGKCGLSGNIFKLLKFLGRSREFLTEREINVYEKLQGNVILDTKIDLELPEITAPILWRRVKSDPYVDSRHFQPYQYEKFEIGRSVLRKSYVTFLVRRDNKLIGYVTRSVRDKKWIDEYNRKQKELGSDLVHLRYDNSGTDFSKTLFGIDEVIEGVTTDVILVEGIFSKTKTDVNLLLDHMKEMKCCVTFGAKFSIHQIELLRLKGVKNIWLWFEADVLDKVKDVATYASLFFNVRCSYLNGIDPNDIGPDEALELLDNAKDYLNFNLSYVKSKLKSDD